MYNLAYAVFVNNEESIVNEESVEWFKSPSRPDAPGFSKATAVRGVLYVPTAGERRRCKS